MEPNSFFGSAVTASSINFVKSDGAVNISSLIPDPDKCDKLIDNISSQHGIRGQLILYDSGSTEIPFVLLQNSLSVLGLQCYVDQNLKTFEYSFCIGDETICSSGQRRFDNKQEAKHELAKEAYDILSKDCFLLKRLREHTDVRQSDLVKINNPMPSSSDFNKPGSMAHNMMLKMGWSGGGLGLKEQGRVENIQIYENVERRGLGNKNILKEVTKILMDFSNSKKFTILAFDSSFSKAEREVIHKTARRFNLKSKSEGKGDNRRITVSRILNRWDIVRELLKTGCKSSSYELEVPEKYKYFLN